MESTSNVLCIGPETTETLDKSAKLKRERKKFRERFTKRLQKLLLSGSKPLIDTPDPDVVERFCATSTRIKGKQYYEFRTDDYTKGIILSGIAFDPKGCISIVKERIGKEYWINENVIKYHNNSMGEIQELVWDCIAEEDSRICNYLQYLQENRGKKK